MKPIIHPAGQQKQHFIIKLSIPFLVAFISLRHLFHEFHEFGHMVSGRLFCGAWGTRDFNRVHAVADQCALSHFPDILVAFAGPLFNYIAIWTGAVLIRTAKSSGRLAWGLTLIFASLPFARLFTVLIGGGDEMGMARVYISNPLTARLTAIAVVSAILIYPLYTAFKALYVKSHKVWYFIGFLILPMILEGAVVLLFFNYLLKIGVLNETWMMGSPILVSIVLLIALITFVLSAKFINSLVKKVSSHSN